MTAKNRSNELHTKREDNITKTLSQEMKYALCYYRYGNKKRNKPTATQKRKLLRYLIDRDGFCCFYCKVKFQSVREPIIEHLNDDPTDNREDNLVLSHQRCNILKAKQSSKEYLNMAELKLEENEQHLYVGESFLEEKSQKEVSTEIDINKKCCDITEKYLTDKILSDGWIDYKETLFNIVYRCRMQIGHGSEQSIRSYIQTFTTTEAGFVMEKDPNTKKKIIRKRME